MNNADIPSPEAASRGSDYREVWLRDYPLALASLGRGPELARLICSLRFLDQKLQRFGVDFILDDIDNCIQLSSDEDAVGFRALADALRLAGPVLADDCSQLASQLYGRLMNAATPALLGLITQAKATAAETGFLSLTPTLKQGHRPQTDMLDLNEELEDMAVTPDGKFVVTASRHGNVSVWSLPLRGDSRLHTFRVPEFTSLCLSADGRFIITGDETGKLSKWDRATGFREAAVSTGGEYVQQISLVGSTHAVALLRHSEICIVDLRSLEVQRNFVAQVPDSLCGLSEDKVLIGTIDGFIDLFDVHSGERLTVLGWHGGFKTERMSQAELLLRMMSSSPMVAVGDADSMNRLSFAEAIDSIDATESQKQRLRKEIQEDPLKHAVQCVSLDVDKSNFAVSGCFNGEVALIDLTQNKIVRRFKNYRTSQIRCCALSSVARVVAAGSYDGTLRLWNIDSGNEIGVLASPDSPVSLHFIPGSSQLIAAFSNGRLQLWRDPAKAAIHSRDEDTSPPRAIASVLERAYTISDSVITCWAPKVPAKIGKQKLTGAPGGIALSPDNRRVLAISDETISISDVCNGWLLRTVELESANIGPSGASGPVKLVEAAVTSDLQRLLTYRYVDLIPVVTGNHSLLELRTGTGKLMHVLDERAGRITHLVVSPDARWAVTVGLRAVDKIVDKSAPKGELRIWDLSTATCVWNHAAPGVTAAEFSEDAANLYFKEGRYLRRCIPGSNAQPEDVVEIPALWSSFIIKGQFAIGFEENTVEVWDLNLSTRVAALTLEAAVSAISVAAGTVVVADRQGKTHFLMNNVLSHRTADSIPEPTQFEQGGTPATYLQQLDRASEFNVAGNPEMAVKIWREIAANGDAEPELRLAIAAQLDRIGITLESTSVRIEIASNHEYAGTLRSRAINELTAEGCERALKFFSGTIRHEHLAAAGNPERRIFLELLGRLIENRDEVALETSAVDPGLPEIARVTIGHALGRLNPASAKQVLAQLARSGDTSVQILAFEGLRQIVSLDEWIDIADEAVSQTEWDDQSRQAVCRMLLLRLGMSLPICLAEHGEFAWYELGLLAFPSELNNRAMALASANLYQEALDLLDLGSRIFPNNPRVYLNRSGLFIRLEKWEPAVQEADRCLELDPNYEKALNFRAYARMELEQFELALEDLNRALKLNPGDFANLTNRAECYRALGRPTEAEADWLEADKIRAQGGDDVAAFERSTRRNEFEQNEKFTEAEYAKATEFLQRTGLTQPATAQMLMVVNDEELAIDMRRAAISAMGTLGADEALAALMNSPNTLARLRIEAAGTLLKRQSTSSGNRMSGVDRFKAARTFLNDVIADASADVQLRGYAAYEVIETSDSAEIERVAQTISDMGTHGESLSDGVQVALVLIRSLGPRKEFARLEALASSRDASGWIRELASQTIGVFLDPEKARSLSRAHLAEDPQDPRLVKSIKRALGMYRDSNDPPSIFPDPAMARAYQEILEARSTSEIDSLSRVYSFITDPDFIAEIEHYLPSHTPADERELLRQKLDYIKTLPPNLEQLAFREFARASSFEQMRAATVKFPVLTIPDFQESIRTSILESIPAAEHEVWMKRLEWLRTIPPDDFQITLEEFINTQSADELSELVRSRPFIRTERFRELVKRTRVVGAPPGYVDERLRWIDGLGKDPGDSLLDEIVDALSSHQPDKALELLNRLRALDPNRPGKLLTAEVYLQNRQNEKAIELFTRSIEEDPSGLAYRRRGRAWFNLNQLVEAMDDYTRALDYAKDDVEALLGRGITFEKLGNFDAAVNDLKRALELRPDDEMIAFPLAMSYLQLGEINSGLTLLKEFPHWSKLFQKEINACIQTFDSQVNPADAAMQALYDATDSIAIERAVNNHPIFWDPEFQKAVQKHIDSLDEDLRLHLAPRFQYVLEIVRHPAQLAFEAFMDAENVEEMIRAIANNEFLRDPSFIAQLRQMAPTVDEQSARRLNRQMEIYDSLQNHGRFNQKDAKLRRRY